MTKIHALPAKSLRSYYDPARIACEDSRSLRKTTLHTSPQPRAEQAVELALHIADKGYNMYLSGGANLGRTYMMLEILRPRARKMPTPPDLVYVYNFDDPDVPLLLTLPAGEGAKLRQNLDDILTKIRKKLPSHFEHDAYVKKRNELLEHFQSIRDALVKEMEKIAAGKGFQLQLDNTGGLRLYPVIDGKRLDEEAFERLDDDIKTSVKAKSDGLLQIMTGLMRKLNHAEQKAKDEERTLDRTVVEEVLNTLFTPFACDTCKRCSCKALEEYFAAVREDIADNSESFLRIDQIPLPDPANPNTPPPFADDDPERFDINVFVDHSGNVGAPIIIEDHPTANNLLGCIERESELGALVTDFTLVKAGALQKANGGFLILHIEDILQHPAAWEGLLRALHSGKARIEDVSESDSSKTKGIEPQDVPLNVKVILVGDDYIYEELLDHDERFSKLFKVKAHMAETMHRDAQGVKLYLQSIRRIIEESALLPFTRDALAGLIDHGSALAEDQKKLSLKYAQLRELMLEASAFATMEQKELVDSAIVQKALDARRYRASLYEEAFLEEYDRDMIKVATSGEAIGHVTGLAVTNYGDFEFGLPHTISCTIGVGTGGIIDLEREAKLGGPIHTKAMMILKSYLLSQFAYNKALILSGNLCFEQNYVGVEGDSASGAELAALISAIAEVPINLSYAFTGAVSQSGTIMAVGGVTQKIEGFFDVCMRRGLSGKQGVIIPADNIDQLMLKKDVVDAVENGKFAIYPVNHIEEALEILTGLPTGKRRKDGSFTEKSLYYYVDTRLAKLGEYAQKPLRSRKR